jgi:NAD+ kinase
MTFGIFGNTGKPALGPIVAELISDLRRRSQPFVVHDELGAWLARSGSELKLSPDLLVSESGLLSRSDILIALGGDGTILAAARIVSRKPVPILGVNLGKLGFLAEVSVGELTACIDDILKGSSIIDERMTLHASWTGASTELFTALNDVVIDRGSSPRVIDLETYVDDEYLATYTADGIIIATPTGSTAYSLASGGPIVEPRSSVIIINPISPHTLTARPVIVPAESVVRVVVKSPNHPVHVSADGQSGDEVATPVEFLIKRGDTPVRLVKRGNRTYFDLLRTKLMWGRDLRADNNRERKSP